MNLKEYFKGKKNWLAKQDSILTLISLSLSLRFLPAHIDIIRHDSTFLGRVDIGVISKGRNRGVSLCIITP